MQASVLALNRAYAPVHVVSVRRAFTLLYKSLAEVVSVEDGQFQTFNFDGWRELSDAKCALEEFYEWDDWIHTVSFAIQVPRVIRLLDYDRVPQRGQVQPPERFFAGRESLPILRQEIRQQPPQSGSRCPAQPRRAVDLGQHRLRCLKCNVRKGGRTPQEAGMHLFRLPTRPARSPTLAHQLTSRKYSAWRNFLD